MMLLLASAASAQPEGAPRPRARDLGIVIGRYPPGAHNAITDVPGVLVGQVSLVRGDDIRTGVTAIVPHGGNLFQEKVPGAVYVGNAFGKLVGSTQIRELGEIETPILLCGTLNVPRVADALMSWMLDLEGMAQVRSINPVVGETNDGSLNDIRGRHVGETEVFAAIRSAAGGPVAEGSVGAGVGTRALGFKGGIGTSSRVVTDRRLGSFTIGVLVQSNFGGELRVNGTPVGNEIRRRERERDPSLAENDEPTGEDGSCMIVVATDAPLTARNLERLAFRALGGMARVGGNFSNGSGDYVIAFSSAGSARIRPNDAMREGPFLTNDAMSTLFAAVMEATEEAILNSLLQATTITGYNGTTSRAVPIDILIEVCRERNLIPPAR